MTPYYQDDYCTVYNCDCRDILPRLPKVDLVLTDPPYGINYRSNHNSSRRGKWARWVRHENLPGMSQGVLPLFAPDTAPEPQPAQPALFDCHAKFHGKEEASAEA